MWRAALWIALLACGPKPVPPPPVVQQPTVSRLSAPPLIDPDVRGAAYLNAVALSLQPAWHQFLEDCRLRLPAAHPLNNLALVASAELEIGPRGQLVAMRLTSSGNADFDRAVEQVVHDASPLSPPPRELWSDDDHVHLTWTFARDRRQAGPASAVVVDVELPMLAVVERRISEHELARAARRILREHASTDRDIAIHELMIAALHEALSSSDIGVRRASVIAIATAGLHDLDAAARELVTSTDTDLSSTVIEQGFVPSDGLVAQLHRDLKDNPKRAAVIVATLAARDRRAAVDALRTELATTPATDAAMLQALAVVPVSDVGTELQRGFVRGDARMRSGVCAAIARYPENVALPVITRGLTDRDANVRASCLAAVREQASTTKPKPTVLSRVRELAKDRDALVRARAIEALGVIDLASLPNAADDSAAEVRAAYATAVAKKPRGESDAALILLANDRDPDVRAAAWTSLVLGPVDRAELPKLAIHAVNDSAAQVRLAALPAIADEQRLLELSNRDESPDVRTRALVQLARIRTRHAIADSLLERLAAGAPGSGERVRTALAWLLAR